MSSIRLFFACRRWNCSPVPFFSPLIYVYVLYVHLFWFAFLIFFFFFNYYFLFWFWFPSPSSCPLPPFWLLCAHSNRAMHPPYSLSQRGTSLAIGSLTQTSWVGVGLSERKIKAIPSIVRFPLFLLWESRAHRMDSEHGALLLSRITTGNVFPCDVTVNNFSAKGNKSVDFGAACVWQMCASQQFALLMCLFTICTNTVFTWSGSYLQETIERIHIELEHISV